MKGTFFITGIDTNIGKSYATGWLAREWNSKGIKTITQKMIQTGNVGHSEDIDLHREIMGIPFTPEDKEQITFPIVYSYPASPHLAAEIDDRIIPIEKITESTRILQSRYDVVLLEGAGGLMVPITRRYLTVDYIADQKLPVILVTSGRLGSINHTLLFIQLVAITGCYAHAADSHSHQHYYCQYCFFHCYLPLIICIRYLSSHLQLPFGFIIYRAAFPGARPFKFFKSLEFSNTFTAVYATTASWSAASSLTAATAASPAACSWFSSSRSAS